MSISRFVALTLRARIDSNDPVLFRQFVDLLLPDPARHHPSWDENDRPPFSGHEKVSMTVKAKAPGGRKRPRALQIPGTVRLSFGRRAPLYRRPLEEHPSHPRMMRPNKSIDASLVFPSPTKKLEPMSYCVGLNRYFEE